MAVIFPGSCISSVVFSVQYEILAFLVYSLSIFHSFLVKTGTLETSLVLSDTVLNWRAKVHVMATEESN